MSPWAHGGGRIYSGLELQVGVGGVGAGPVSMGLMFKSMRMNGNSSCPQEGGADEGRGSGPCREVPNT
jgi:hypothetical protein